MLGSLPLSLRRPYAKKMRDAGLSSSIRRAFVDEPGWEDSLVRFGQAQDALVYATEAFEGRLTRDNVISFDFALPASTNQPQTPPTVNFTFDPSDMLPGRVRAVIGYNGVGKTRLLADIAMAASLVGESSSVEGSRGRLSGPDSTLPSILAISFSAFDSFALPFADPNNPSGSKTDRFGYVYCGLRTGSGGDLKRQDEVGNDLLAAAEVARRTADRRAGLRRALKALQQEPSFARLDTDLATLATRSAPQRREAEDQLRQASSGHKIAVSIVTHVAAHVRQRSLVLIDEPESHLHPSLLAALMRVLQDLLDYHDAFAIVATHSPVVLQEVPRKCVTVLERFGSIVRAREPMIETFAEDIGIVTDHIFSLDSSNTDFRRLLMRLARNLTLEEANELFDGRMSAQGRALFMQYQREPRRSNRA